MGAVSTTFPVLPAFSVEPTVQYTLLGTNCEATRDFTGFSQKRIDVPAGSGPLTFAVIY